MNLDDALASLPGALVPAQLDRFRSQIDAHWLDEALAATGTATVRKRRLPAEQVVWLVIGMALLRNDSIDRVVAMLDLALPTPTGLTAAKSAIAKARQRLGAEPVEHLFSSTGEHWGHASAGADRWRGLALYAMDGTVLRVPDSQDNWEAFGGHVGNGERAGSAYPMVRMVALMAVRSHLIAAAKFDKYAVGEVTLAGRLWDEVPDGSLTIIDRGFAHGAPLYAYASSGNERHWLTRMLSRMPLTEVRKLGRKDMLMELTLSREARRLNPELPERMLVRAIRYKRKGFEESTLLTSLLDPVKYPAAEIVALYHERWEIELGYDEVKTHLLAREEAIRSRTPAGVRQEMWGILLAYNLVRLEMEKAADEIGVPPTRISFTNALAMVRYAFLSASTVPLAPGRIPATLLNVRRDIKLLLLPERRERSYPREVKIKMSNYLKKQPRHRK